MNDLAETYKCANCQETFSKGWTDDEAKDEYKENFGVDYSEQDTAIVCEPCYQEMQAFIQKQDEEYARKKNEYEDWLASLSPTARMLKGIIDRAVVQSMVNDIIGPKPTGEIDD